MISRAILLVLEGTKRVMITVSAIFIVILLWGVFSRYVLNVAVSWVEELAIMLMIWLVFLGIGVAASERAHIGMPIVRDSLPVPVRRFVILLTNLLMMVSLSLGVCAVHEIGLRAQVAAGPTSRSAGKSLVAVA